MMENRYNLPSITASGTIASATSNTEIISAPGAGKKIVICGISMSADPGGNAQTVRMHFDNTGTNRTIGRARLSAGGGEVFPFIEYLAGDENENVELDTGDASNLDWWVQYYIINS